MDNGVKVRQPGKKGNTPWQHRPSHPESRNIRRMKESFKGRQQNKKKHLRNAKCKLTCGQMYISCREYQKKDTIIWIWEKTKLDLKEEKKLTCVQLYISCRMQRGTQCHPLQLHTWPQFVKLSSWHNISTFCNILIFYNISIFYNIFHPLQLHTCQAFVNLVETCKHMTQLYQQDKDPDECKINQDQD